MHFHKHDHSHGHHSHGAHKNLKVAFFLNLFFTILELIGGYLTNSVAVLSDAIHDLGDTVSLGSAWYLEVLSNRGIDKKFSFGYKRFSLLGAVINCLVLIIGSMFVIRETIPRLLHPEEPNVEGMIAFAILGVLVNGAAVLRLKKGDSLNERAVMMHLMEDVLGWIAVLIGAVFMYFFDFPIVDPILSLLITSYVLYNVYFNIKKSVSIFLQMVPDNVDLTKVKGLVESVEDVRDAHDIHVWSLDGIYNILTLHVEVGNDLSVKRIIEIKREIKQALLKGNVHHATIEIEVPSENRDCNSQSLGC